MSSYSFYERIEGHIYIKSFLSRTDYPDSINQSVIRIQIHILVFRTELYRQGVTTFCQSNRDRITQSPIIQVALAPVRHHHRTRFLSVYQQSTDSRLVFCVYRSVAIGIMQCQIIRSVGRNIQRNRNRCSVMVQLNKSFPQKPRNRFSRLILWGTERSV